MDDTAVFNPNNSVVRLDSIATGYPNRYVFIAVLSTII
jgi:hypothetical protein